MTNDTYHHPVPATSRACTSLSGSISVPGDKSISHRALMLSSQVKGTTSIHGLLEGEDVLATASALKQLGVIIEHHATGEWLVHGVGIGGFKESAMALDMGNAGTGARLMMGLLAPYPFMSVFTGDESLSRRPMKRVITPLSEMGVSITAREGQYLPLMLQGTTNTKAITYELPVASAQVKSAILLAGLNTERVTTVIEPTATRDHTERMMRFFGIPITQDGERISITGKPSLPARDSEITVPGDPSSAAFPVVAALICPDSELTIRNIGTNPLRTGLFTTLQEMGADITLDNEREEGGEPVADIHVRSSSLKGIQVPAERAPSMIDEYPILAVAAACANGDTVMHGLAELRVKESDRLQAIIDGLAANGVRTSLDGDTLTVHGTGGNVVGGGLVSTHFDHRIAMSFLILGAVSAKPVMVDDTRAIATSFPRFIELMNGCGSAIQVSASLPMQHAQTSISTPIQKVIAIDGPAASGKGTLARRLADHYGMAYLDTGSLYRAVGMKLVYADKDPHDKDAAIQAAKQLSDQDLHNPRLRQERVGQAASIVSAIPEVRDILLSYQRDFARRPGGAVLDGRDIGTVVCPDADFKLFLTAGIEARAKRRHRQLQGEGIEVIYDSVLDDLKERDERDRQRDAAPLIAAEDAVKLDTTDIDANSVFKKVVELIDSRLAA